MDELIIRSTHTQDIKRIKYFQYNETNSRDNIINLPDFNIYMTLTSTRSFIYIKKTKCFNMFHNLHNSAEKLVIHIQSYNNTISFNHILIDTQIILFTLKSYFTKVSLNFFVSLFKCLF